jgi:hypothetical protein
VIAPYINAAFTKFEDCPIADGADGNRKHQSLYIGHNKKYLNPVV